MIEILQLPVVQRREVANGLIEVTCSTNGKGFSFRAGQHIKVNLSSLLRDDPKGKTRTFNILSSPNNTDYLSFAFMRSDSGFKQTLLKMPINGTIEVKGPYGVFILPNNSANPIIMIAEGVGVSPCISMLLYATEENLPNKITLLYADTNSNMPYLDDLSAIEKENPNFTLKTKQGRMDDGFIKKNSERADSTLWYVAGTSEMTSRVKNILIKSNVNMQNMHFEEFAGY